MPEFLSDAWIAGLGDAAAAQAVPADLRLTIQQVVDDGDGAPRSFVVRIAEGAVSVEPGTAPDVDVTFTQDRTTATAIARGELSAQAAFMAGALQVEGSLHRVIDHALELATLADLFAAMRASTTWGPRT
ncbi:MAG: SCP2 sterol-binding domain-containing protein [Microthrixaceae bacterium]